VKGIDVDKLNSDLLMALLAIVTDAVPHSAVAEALRLWTNDPGQSLTHWLKKSAGLDDARIRTLESLAAAHLKAHQSDLRLGPDAFNPFEATQDVLTEINNDAMRTTLGALHGDSKTLPLVEGTPDHSLVWVLNQHQPPPGGERFQRIRPHAQGGIGQVWVARDSELQRDVALKEIQPRYAERADHRSRFVLEAEITGNLEHPGIVPVYSLGRNPDGRPYYAMRFIQGESMLVAIRRFHTARREQLNQPKTDQRPAWGIEFRQLLRRFLDVCDAIDYAHSRGVIHRDLKPANIMLGRYGETLVVDWGLAKVVGTTDVIVEQGNGSAEPGLSGGSITATQDTVFGTTIGTPSYMSPEQAKGAIDELGPRSDVYSLGATLYELLTGEVPFTGKRVGEIIEKVLKGEFPRPRSHDRTLPAPLEAICVQALAHDPAERYPSVRCLAQDLEHWLADEPVSAYPEQRLERLTRWLRRHRTWTYAAAAALVGIALAATIGVVVVDQARRREEVVRKEAETNFNMAQQAVDDYLTKVSENTLLQQQDSNDFRSLRRELLNNALAYYKKFVNERGHDLRLRGQLANAYFRVGEITKEIASSSDAIEAFRSAQDIWAGLAAAEPQSPELRARLADCHLAIGTLQSTSDDLHEALTSLNRARELLAALAKENPGVPSYSAGLAVCYMRIGIVQGNLKALDEAQAALERAKTIQEGVIGRVRDETFAEQKLAEITMAMGILSYERKQLDAALQSFKEVRQISQTLLDRVTDSAKPVEILDLIAIAHYDIAAIQIAQGNSKEGLESFHRSLEYRSKLMEDHRSVTRFQEQFGKNLGELALLEHKLGQDEKADITIKKSIDVLENLVRSQPDQPVYHHDLGRSWNIRGFLQDEARNNQPATESLNRALTEERRAVEKAPDVDLYKIELSTILDNLGEQYIDLGQVPTGLPYYRDRIALWRRLHADRPQKSEYIHSLATALVALAQIERHASDAAAAQTSLANAREVLEGGGNDITIRALRGAILNLQATLLIDQEKWNEAIPLLKQSVDTLSHLGPMADSSADDDARGSLSDALWALARAARATGQTAGAQDYENRRAALWKNRPEKLAKWSLESTARHALLIGYGKTPIADPARSIRVRELDLAAADLVLAISLGFKDFDMVRRNPDAWALLDRPDLDRLIKKGEPASAAGSQQPQKEP
jgi:serine/threonine protein kinase